MNVFSTPMRVNGMLGFYMTNDQSKRKEMEDRSMSLILLVRCLVFSAYQKTKSMSKCNFPLTLAFALFKHAGLSIQEKTMTCGGISSS